MEKVLEKISSYNLFNNLFTGGVALLLSRYYLKFEIYYETVVYELIIIYFVGMVFNRVGSLIVNPILKKFKIIKFLPYEKFLQANRVDEKINVLQQEANIYRTLTSIFLFAILIKSFIFFQEVINFNFISKDLVIIILLILFVISYIKQTNIIVKRIEKQVNKNQ